MHPVRAPRACTRTAILMGMACTWHETQVSLLLPDGATARPLGEVGELLLRCGADGEGGGQWGGEWRGAEVTEEEVPEGCQAVSTRQHPPPNAPCLLLPSLTEDDVQLIAILEHAPRKIYWFSFGRPELGWT